MLLVVGSHSVLVYVVCKLHVHQDIGDSCTWKECLLRMPLLLRLQLREFPSAPRKDPTTKDVKRRQVSGPRPGSGELWLSIRRLWTTASA